MLLKRVRVALTGAAGNIGYSLLFRLLSGDVFGRDVVVDLNLMEVEAQLAKLEGVVMEIVDCAFPLLGNLNMSSNATDAFDGVNYAILVGSAPRRAGMERSDLLKINANIFKSQGEALDSVASSDIKVLVVGNPCNTNCMIAMHSAENIPNDRFFAMTMLDQNRATFQLAQKAKCSVSEISDMIIWGNHSSTQYPDVYNAKIKGIPAAKLLNRAWLEGEFVNVVRQRGAAIIEKRGASSAASAANGIIDSILNLRNDTVDGSVFSMATCSGGEYDVPPGLICSFPCRTKNFSTSVVLGFEHNDFGNKKFMESVEELKQEAEIVHNMGII